MKQRLPDRLAAGQFVSAVVVAPVMTEVEEEEVDVFSVYTGKAWVLKASTFDKDTVTTGAIFGETIDVIILYTGETAERLLEDGDPVSGLLYPIRETESGAPLLLVAPAKRCD